MSVMARVRWRSVVPTVMMTFTGYLLGLATTQRWDLERWAPAKTLAVLINGPAFFGTRFLVPLPDAVQETFDYEAGVFFGIALFWFVVGLSIERRIAGKKLAKSYPKIGTTLFIVASLVAGGFGLTVLRSSTWLSDPDFAWNMAKMAGLQSRYTVELGTLIWVILLTIFFIYKWIEAARYPRPTT
jgi:hypothetical protein